MTEIEIKAQKTTLQVTSGDKIITIENITIMTPSFKTIISNFFDNFKIITIEDAPKKEEPKHSVTIL